MRQRGGNGRARVPASCGIVQDPFEDHRAAFSPGGTDPAGGDRNDRGDTDRSTWPRRRPPLICAQHIRGGVRTIQHHMRIKRNSQHEPVFLDAAPCMNGLLLRSRPGTCQNQSRLYEGFWSGRLWRRQRLILTCKCSLAVLHHIVGDRTDIPILSAEGAFHIMPGKENPRGLAIAAGNSVFAYLSREHVRERTKSLRHLRWPRSRWRNRSRRTQRSTALAVSVWRFARRQMNTKLGL